MVAVSALPANKSRLLGFKENSGACTSLFLIGFEAGFGGGTFGNFAATFGGVTTSDFFSLNDKN